MNRDVIIVLSVITCMVLMLLNASELKAPEISERDRYGYEPFRVAESGAIIDKDGVIHGWLNGKTVYDVRWNARYRVQHGKACVIPEKTHM